MSNPNNLSEITRVCFSSEPEVLKYTGFYFLIFDENPVFSLHHSVYTMVIFLKEKFLGAGKCESSLVF